MAQRTDEGCVHNRDMGFEYPCPACDPTPDDPKLHSIGFAFVGGQDMFHGNYGTIREQTDEMFKNAKKYGHEPPEYQGPRSKMRSLDEISKEMVESNPNLVDSITGEGKVEASVSDARPSLKI